MKIINNIQQNWSAKSSKIGVIFHKWIASILLLCSVVGGLNELTSTFPVDWIPQWVKYVILGAAIISYVGGKLTKEQPKQ